jgi:hypothetical protein
MLALSFTATNLKADDPEKDEYHIYGASYGETAEESIFVAALNEYRVSRGLQSVTVNGELSSACREWSTRMRQRGQLSHDLTGGGMEVCAQISQESGMNALRAWQRSSAHNAILLSPRIDTIGIGSDGIWWTMRGRQMNAERTEYTVFRPTDARTAETKVSDDIPGYRVPMSVAETRTYQPSRQSSVSASSRFRTYVR